MTPRRATSVLLLCSVAVACDSAPSRLAARWWTAAQLIDPAPRELFRREALAETTVALEWDFSGERATWPPVSGSIDPTWSGPGLRLLQEAGQLAFAGETDLEASEVEELEVTVARRGLWAAVAYWSGPDGEFTPECSLRLSGAEAAAETVRFSVVSHPCWKGRIRRLRLVVGVPEQRVRILAVRAVRREFPRRLAAELDGTTWRFEAGGEVRDARLAAPGGVWSKPVRLPAEARLSFAYTPGELSDSTIEFSLAYRADSASEVELFRDRLEPRPPGEGVGWRKASVVLPATLERAGTLVFRVQAPGGDRRLRSLPAWGDLRLQSLERRPGADIALISVDTLRGDRLSLVGYSRAVSPRIDAWARRTAVCFLRAFAPSPWTLPSHVSMLTGLDTISHGVNTEASLPEDIEVVTQRMRDAGYRTVAITGGGYLHPLYRLERGFDSYRFWKLGLGDENELVDGVARALEILRESSDEALFLFFHTYEVHFPYSAREPFFSQFAGAATPKEPLDVAVDRLPSGAENGYVVANRFRRPEGNEAPRGDGRSIPDLLYDSGVAFADSQLGMLLDALEARSVERPTMTILTSDHGEALGERGLAFHAYPYDFNLHVPLLVAFPQRRDAGTRRSEAVGLIDLVPTMLGAAGLEVLRTDGTDLASATLPPRRILWSYAGSSNWGLAARLGDRWKVLFNDTAWLPVRGRIESYRLDSDPAEKEDLGRDPEVVGRLLSEITKRLAVELGGLHVRVRSPAGRALRGELRSPEILAQRVKVPDQGNSGSLHWLEGGGVGFELPPGTSLRLIVHARELGDLEVHLADGGPQKHQAVSAEDLRRGFGLRRTPAGWAEASPESADPDLALALTWVGSHGRSGTRVEDQPLAQQLRALGYL